MDSIEQFRQFVEGLNFDWPNAVIIKDRIGRHIESIEDEHVRLMRQAINMSDFCERLEEAAKKREDVTLFGVDYVALPVDEDGVAIRPGDVIDGYNCTSEVAHLVLTRSCGWIIETDIGGRFSDSQAFKHYKEPDVCQ